MTRWKAAAIHFAISVAVISLIAAFVVWRWYPPQLFAMAKAGELMSLLGGVDVILGPLLTLVVYKQGKQSLKFDLSMIALFQVAAMTFGLSVLWQSRPVFIVAADDRFRMIFANEIAPANLRQAPEPFKTLPAWGPLTVGAPLPRDPKKRTLVIQQALNGLDISLTPEYFEPYPPADPAFLAQGLTPEDVLRSAPPADRDAWKQAFASAEQTSGNVLAFPLSSSRGQAAALVDAQTGAILGYSKRIPVPADGK